MCWKYSENSVWMNGISSLGPCVCINLLFPVLRETVFITFILHETRALSLPVLFFCAGVSLFLSYLHFPISISSILFCSLWGTCIVSAMTVPAVPEKGHFSKYCSCPLMWHHTNKNPGAYLVIALGDRSSDSHSLCALIFHIYLPVLALKNSLVALGIWNCSSAQKYQAVLFCWNSWMNSLTC